MPANALPLLLPAEENAYRIQEAVRAGVGDAAGSSRQDAAIAVPIRTIARNQQHKRGHLHLEASIFFGTRGASHHQAGDEHRDYGEHQHAVRPLNAAEDDLAQLQATSAPSPQRRERSCIAMTDPFDAAVVAVAQAPVPDAEADSLPSMLPPTTGRWPAVGASAAGAGSRVARRATAPIGSGTKSPHRREQRQPWRVSRTTERCNCAPNHEDRQHFEEV